MKHIAFLVAVALPFPAFAQVTAVLPVICNPNSPGDCVRATPVVNPDGTNIASGSSGGGGGAVTVANGADIAEGPTTAAAYADATGASAASLIAINKGQYVALSGLFKAGQSIGNSGFASFGSAGTAYQQGTGAAGANAQNVYVGGQNAPLSVVNAGTFAVQAAQSGTWTDTVTQATAANLNATIVGTGTFAVQNTASTPAGTAIIGKVGIDQTTPGVTNNVTYDGVTDGVTIPFTNGGTSGTNVILATGSTTGMATGTLYVTALASGMGNVSVMQTIDGTSWFNTPVFNTANTGSTSTATSTAFVGSPYSFAVLGSAYRLVSSGTVTSGITSGAVVFKRIAPAIFTQVTAPVTISAINSGGAVAPIRVDASGILVQRYGNQGSSTALGASAVYTGAANDLGGSFAAPQYVSSTNSIGVSVLTDQPGTAFIDVSTDATTWRQQYTITVAGGGLIAQQMFGASVRYWRVRYVNGATAQTYFNIIPITSSGVERGDGTSIGNVLRSTPYNDTTTALGASATFTGLSRDSGAAGSPTTANMFSCFVRADQSGTLNQQGSNDNTTFFTEMTAAIAANVSVTTTGRVYTRYHRCQVVNGTTAQTSLVVNSQLGE